MNEEFNLHVMIAHNSIFRRLFFFFSVAIFFLFFFHNLSIEHCDDFPVFADCPVLIETSFDLDQLSYLFVEKNYTTSFIGINCEFYQQRHTQSLNGFLSTI